MHKFLITTESRTFEVTAHGFLGAASAAKKEAERGERIDAITRMTVASIVPLRLVA